MVQCIYYKGDKSATGEHFKVLQTKRNYFLNLKNGVEIEVGYIENNMQHNFNSNVNTTTK